MKRLMLVSPADSIHTYRWAKFLNEQGLEICLVSATAPSFDYPVTELHCLKAQPFNRRLPGLLCQLSAIYGRFRPDLVHVHYLTYLGWLPALLCFKPLVITLWGSDILRPSNSFWGRRLTDLSFRRSSLVTADARNMLDIAEARGARHTDLLLFGAEQELFHPLGEREALRSAYGLPAGAWLVLSPRAMTPYYRHEVLLQACHQLRLQQPELHLLLLTFNADLAYLDQLKQLVTELGLEGRVHFLPRISRDKLAELYSMADVMVSLPQTDGTPATFFESMACGLPVLSNRHAAYEDLFSENRDLFYFSPDDATGLAAGLNRIKADPELRQLLIQQGFDTARRFSASHEMGRMLLHYRRLAGQQS